MRSSRWASFLATGLLFVHPAYPQECPEATTPLGDSLAQRLAPVFEFGPGEHYFPTIPFFAAFDDFRGGKGLADSAAVAPMGAKGISWQKLDSAYTQRLERKGDKLVPRYSAVFYRVRCLDDKENDRVVGFLRNDPQAWWRLRLDSLYQAGLDHASFNVIEYYTYYMADVGLEGHPYDIERVYVFAPRFVEPQEAWLREGERGRKRAREVERANSLVDSVRIIVGTGHTPTTPNNVLVTTWAEAAQSQTLAILVELGGHSSAADRDRDALFSLGYDANWNLAANLWGTRDIQAVAGLGFLGSYHEWMTLPRHDANSVTLEPLAASISEGGNEVSSKYLADTLRAAQAGLAPTDTAVINKRNTYVLLPVAPFKRLYEALEDYGKAMARGDSAQLGVSTKSVRTLVEDSIRPRLEPAWHFRGFQGIPESADMDVVRRMTMWTRPTERYSQGGGEIPVSRSLVWKHPEFDQSSVWTLKRRLFRPSFESIRNAGDVASLAIIGTNLALGRGGQEMQFGFVVPGRRFIFPIPGIVEPRIGLYRRRLLGADGEPTHVSFSLTYERHYKALFSWYVRPLNYVSGRRKLEGDPEASDFTIGFGGSLMPLFPFPNILRGVGQFLRIRGGVRVDSRHWEPRIRRFELQGLVYFR